MGERIEFWANDTSRAIADIAQHVSEFDSPLCNERAKALVLTKLEEAWFWALRLVNHDDVPAFIESASTGR